MPLREIDNPGTSSRSIANDACWAIGGRYPGWFTKSTCNGERGPLLVTSMPTGWVPGNGPATAAGVMQAELPAAGVVQPIALPGAPLANSVWKMVAAPAIPNGGTPPIGSA